MATAILERAEYELEREKRFGLVPYTTVPDYDLVVADPSTGEQSYGRYLGTIMPSPPPGGKPTYSRPVPYTGTGKYAGPPGVPMEYGPPQGVPMEYGPPQGVPMEYGTPGVPMEYPTMEIDGYERGPSRSRPPSALPISSTLVRPLTATPPSSYPMDFRPISPDYRPSSRPKSAMASLGGALGEAAGRKYDTLPVYLSQVLRVEDIPIEQYYDLTQLRRSNLRSDDQVLPRPEACDMTKLAVNRTFPAEHPLSSHTVEKAVFPKFAESPDDPRNGVDAWRTLPKSTNVPSNPTEVIVVKKTKGHGERHEIHQFPVGESLKRPLHWPGDHGFDQQVKAHGGKQQYYPAPTKTYVPNLEKRPPQMQISERTANALANVERGQWTTTYDRNNTGYGAVHALAVDNFDDKVRKYRASGDLDDNLYPCSVPVFDPPRPVEGRIARVITPRPPPQVPDTDWRARPHDEPRKMTEKELDEIRLLYGREYVNLPEGKLFNSVYADPWQQRSGGQDGSANQNGSGEGATKPAQFYEHTDDSKLKIQEMVKHEMQQMEAANRWRELQSSKPNHDLEALQFKYSELQGKEHPNVFYKHERKYQEERAGLYQTDYIPEKLAASMNTTTGPERVDTSQSHVDAINHPSRLNVEMDAIRAYSGIRHRDQANNTGRLLPSEILDPELMRKYQQKLYLQPSAATSRPVVQENGFIGRESEYQGHYNQEKFLQENAIHPMARSEPSLVMSNQNQKLNNVRDYAMKRSKTVHFSNDITVATGAGDEPIRICSAPMNGAHDGEEYRRRVEDEMRQKEQEVQQREGHLVGETLNDNQAVSSHAMYRPPHDQHKLQRSVSFEQIRPKRGSYNTDNMFVSKSSNFMPSGVQQQEVKSSYESQFPTSYSLNFPDDNNKFLWRPGMGRPRPRTQLLDLQDSFSKTKAIRDFNRKFPELHADLRSHVISGRRHTFDGIHAQTFRGN